MKSEGKDHLETGRIGEDIACEFLKRKGFSIIDRNYSKPWGEIDIIAIDKNKTIVFVEVKTMKTNKTKENGKTEFFDKNSLIPEDQITNRKLGKLRRVCESFVLRYPHLLDEKSGWQIDAIAIEMFSDGDREIRHYENI